MRDTERGAGGIGREEGRESGGGSGVGEFARVIIGSVGVGESSGSGCITGDDADELAEFFVGIVI